MIEVVKQNPFGRAPLQTEFIVVGNEVEVRAVRIRADEFPLDVVDKQGTAFKIWQNPTMTCVHLALLTTPEREEFFRDAAGKMHAKKSTFKDPGWMSCVDARIVMAHILYAWSFGDTTYDEFDAAMNPLPSIEEATEWLRINRFWGENRYVGLDALSDVKLDNVPKAVLELHDKNMGVATKYYWERHDDEEWEDDE